MRFNHLLSFLLVTFSFALSPALVLFVLLPQSFPAIIYPVEIIYLSFSPPAFHYCQITALPLSLLLSILSLFLSLSIIASLSSLFLSLLLPA